MAELALIASPSVENPEIKPWQRMEGEPTRWYSRYKRYQSLGPKRTVAAAVEQERKQSRAPKSTGNQGKPKPARVPGSWKQASSKYHWVERSLAYDEDKITQIVALEFEDLYSGPALAFNRVMMLQKILDTVQRDFNANNARMSPDQKVAYFARMTTILRDIKEEMRWFDHATQALVLRHFAAKIYEDSKAPLTAERALQLVEQAGSMEALHEGLEKEKARRQELAQIRKELERAFHGDGEI